VQSVGPWKSGYDIQLPPVSTERQEYGMWHILTKENESSIDMENQSGRSRYWQSNTKYSSRTDQVVLSYIVNIKLSFYARRR